MPMEKIRCGWSISLFPVWQQCLTLSSWSWNARLDSHLSRMNCQMFSNTFNHVWAYDFVEDWTRDGRRFRMLCVVDEFTREALAIRVARSLTSSDVIDVLADLFLTHGRPAHIRSDQGPEFIAAAVKDWIAGVGARTAYIEKASPWENGYVESFNGKLRDELLNREVFNTLREAQVLIEAWRRHYNRVRPHSALGYRPPAPATVPMAGSLRSSGAGPAAMAH
jgi:putative transposase